MRGSVAMLVLGVGCLMATATATRAQPPGAPDVAECPSLKPLSEPLNDRTRPLPVPPPFEMLVSSSAEQFAVATIYGGTVCIDTRGMIKAGTFTISDDRRFVEFDWSGYEADGHVVIDRTGMGQVIDTGVSPASSPSGRRFAAVQQSEAAFGSLEGFGVWQVGVTGLRRLTLQEDIPALADWRIDGWAGENCINLSGVPHDRIPAGDDRLAKLPRERYAAAPVGDGWILSPSADGCPETKSRK